MRRRGSGPALDSGRCPRRTLPAPACTLACATTTRLLCLTCRPTRPPTSCAVQGRPKGVEITHGGLRDLIAFFVDKMALTGDDVFCLNTTVCFDPYVLYLYGCLATGGRLVIPKPDGHVGACCCAGLLAPGLAWPGPLLAEPPAHHLCLRSAIATLCGGSALAPCLECLPPSLSFSSSSFRPLHRCRRPCVHGQPVPGAPHHHSGGGWASRPALLFARCCPPFSC